MRWVVDVTGQTSWGQPEGAPGSGDPRHWDGGLQVADILGGARGCSRFWGPQALGWRPAGGSWRSNPPQIGKAGFGHLGLHRENGKVKGWEVWG